MVGREKERKGWREEGGWRGRTEKERKGGEWKGKKGMKGRK